MPDPLLELWAEIRAHLPRAWVDLSPGDNADLAPFSEYLDHNELELAMDEVASVAARRDAPGIVWRALADAADFLGLTLPSEEFRRRPSPGPSSA